MRLHDFPGINAVGFAVWISLNTFLLPDPWHPFPFSFLTLVVPLEAIFLSIFILIAGNRQARGAERRSHLDLQINLLAEQENTKNMKLLHLIATKLGVGHEAVGLGLVESISPQTVSRTLKKTNLSLGR